MKSAGPFDSATIARPPSLRRRIACFIYEGVLLFGVLMMAGYLFSGLSQQRHALVGRGLLQVFLFVVVGIYFVWFWSHGGQTVAMKTWHIRLVTRDGYPVPQSRALARYVTSWCWFMPALLVAWLSGTRSLAVIFWSLIAGVLAYAATSRLNRDRQFPHDLICSTRLISTLNAREG